MNGKMPSQVEVELSKCTPSGKTLLTVGVFDGVHIGHRHLFEYLKRYALVRDLIPGVVTFNTHPIKVLNPRVDIHLLTSVEERVNLLRSTGLEVVCAITFTPELAQRSAPEFISLLQKHLNMVGLVVGPDFALGKNREGDAFLLHKLSKEMNFTVEVVSPFVQNGGVVSSTSIREALSKGDLERVNHLLGRYYSLRGKIAHGDAIGRTLGFPTANIVINSERAIPADGVYAAFINLSNMRLKAAVNIGFRPTFGGKERTIEVFVLDFSGDLYGQEAVLELVKKIRDENHFASADELIRQINADIIEIRQLLNLPACACPHADRKV